MSGCSKLPDNQPTNRKRKPDKSPRFEFLLTNELRDWYSRGEVIMPFAPELQRLRVEYWPIERLRPYERNARKNDKAVDRIRASIREFGFAVPILAKSD